MRRSVFLIFTNAMILIVVFALLTQALVIVPRLAQTERAQGRVEVRRGGNGEWKTLKTGGFVKNGDVVRTGDRSFAEFVWAGGTRMKLMPKSEMTIAKAVYNSVNKGDTTSFKLSTGSVFVRIMKSLNPTSSFEVETPTAVAAVRGTIFMVRADKNGKSEIAVWKGKVDVKSAKGSAQTSITPGKLATVPTAGALSTRDDAQMSRDFQAEPTIVLPHLKFSVRALGEGRATVRGECEAGNRATLNGKSLRVLGNGSFLKRVKLQPGANTFTIVVTDKHGATSTQTQTVQG